MLQIQKEKQEEEARKRKKKKVKVIEEEKVDNETNNQIKTLNEEINDFFKMSNQMDLLKQHL